MNENLFYEYTLKMWWCKKSIVLSVISIEDFKTLKFHIFLIKHWDINRNVNLVNIFLIYLDI